MAAVDDGYGWQVDDKATEKLGHLWLKYLKLGEKIMSYSGKDIDPITLSVVRGVLETTQREMTLTLEKQHDQVFSTWLMITPRPCSIINQK